MRIIICGVIAGFYTGVMAIIPVTKDTSFRDISVTFEVWILLGTLIIINSKSALDSAMKCFVFFLISQPLVYLVQVPFNADGWGIFRYYPLWGIWTLCTIPMGYIGWYIKKEKWWGVIVLSSMMLFLGFFYRLYLTEMVSYFPKHILTVIFCVATFVTCGLFIFHDRKLRIAQFMINLFIIAVMTLLVFVNGRNVYNTSLLPCSDELSYDDTCEVSLKNKKFGEVSIGYDEGIGTYIINANFTDIGQTELILTTKDGTEHRYKLNIYRNSYEIDEIK